MKYTLKDITHFDFFDGLEKFSSEMDCLLESEKTDIADFKKYVNDTIKNIKQYLVKHINPTAENYIDLLSEYKPSSKYDFWRLGNNDEANPFSDDIERLSSFKRSLRKLVGYLSITETLIDSNRIIFIKSISEKNEFILSKLNSIFSDETYSIAKILEFNDIEYRIDETREIAEDLSKRGYLILLEKYGNTDEVKISVKGARYIERLSVKKNTAKQKTELDKKIDIVLEQLTKLGYGQEIIFDEINELRELQYKLSKKSFSQLLKGKIVDLALDKLISSEVATSIYEYLTNNSFKLLK